MERMNEVRIIGNVGMVNSSDKHTYIAVAVNESYKVKGADEWTDKTVWMDVVLFGPNREKVTKQGIAKGDGILVMGKLDSSEFEGKRKVQIIANKVQLVQKRTIKENTGEDSAPPAEAPPETPAAPAEPPLDAPAKTTTSDGDDLPF